jgi:hypothetical protein
MRLDDPRSILSWAWVSFLRRFLHTHDFLASHTLLFDNYTLVCPKTLIKNPREFLCVVKVFLDIFVDVLHIKIDKKNNKIYA